MPLPQAERAKQESPIIEEVSESAREQRYDENLVKAFVSVGVQLWLIRHVETGEMIFVDETEYEIAMGEAPPVQRTTVAPSTAPGAGPGPRPFVDLTVPDAEGSAESDPDFALSLPPVRERLTEDARGQWELVHQVVGPDELLTLTDDRAVYYGLARRVVADEQELMAFFGAAEIRRYPTAWSESLVRFLINPYVRGVLLVVFLVGLFIELAAPGVGVFGMASLVALAVLLGAPALVGMAQWWDVMLVIVGILLVLVELFLLPGVGLAGMAGAVCLLVGIVGSFVSGDLATGSGGQTQLVTGLLTTLLAFFASGIALWLIGRQAHGLPILRRAVLSATVTDGSGDAGRPTLLRAMAAREHALEGRAVGRAISELRPSGKAEFDGRIYDARSIGPFVGAGAAVRLIRETGFGLEVEPVEDGPGAGPAEAGDGPDDDGSRTE